MGVASVAATSPTDVWAVGTGWDGAFGDTGVFARWEGAGWRHFPAPHIDGYSYMMQAVDTVSAQEAWAVGLGRYNVVGTPAEHLFVARFDGAGWSRFPVSPPAGATASHLSDIDMLSNVDGWAVGTKLVSTGGPVPIPDAQPLALRWRNGQWVQVAMPSLTDAWLTAVHAQAANDVWAVGSQGNSALVMHFDGTRWSRIGVAHGGPSGAYNDLQAVTAVSATDVWAAGNACTLADEGASCQPLALHLSGGTWRAVPTSTGGTHLTGVAARAANDVWLVGYNAPPGQPEANHIEHWDGQMLRPVPTDSVIAPLSSLASALRAVTVIPGTGELWAAGWTDTDAQVIRHS